MRPTWYLHVSTAQRHSSSPETKRQDEAGRVLVLPYCCPMPSGGYSARWKRRWTETGESGRKGSRNINKHKEGRKSQPNTHNKRTMPRQEAHRDNNRGLGVTDNDGVGRHEVETITETHTGGNVTVPPTRHRSMNCFKSPTSPAITSLLFNIPHRVLERGSILALAANFFQILDIIESIRERLQYLLTG